MFEHEVSYSVHEVVRKDKYSKEDVVTPADPVLTSRLQPTDIVIFLVDVTINISVRAVFVVVARVCLSDGEPCRCNQYTVVVLFVFEYSSSAINLFVAS